MAHVIRCKYLLDSDLGAPAWRGGLHVLEQNYRKTARVMIRKRKTYDKKRKNLLQGGI